jgi:hypothetical protein
VILWSGRCTGIVSEFQGGNSWLENDIISEASAALSGLVLF